MRSLSQLVTIAVFFLVAILPFMTLEGRTAPVADWTATTEDLMRLLTELRIPHDPTNLQRAAIEAMLKTLDPAATVGTALEPSADSSCSDDGLVAEEWPEDMGYLKIRRFQPGTGSNVVSIISAWLEKGRSSLVIDLRASSGSDLASVDEIAGVFVPEDVELYVVRDFRGNTTHSHKAAGSGRVGTNMLTSVVAVDSDTRGAAEALAAVLKGRAGVILVGWRTRGDLALREWVEFGSNAAARIVVSKILLPGCDEAESFKGVEPDVAVTGIRPGRIPQRPPPGRAFSEKSERSRELMRRVADDPVLGSAVDILLGLKAVGFCGQSGGRGAAAR